MTNNIASTTITQKEDKLLEKAKKIFLEQELNCDTSLLARKVGSNRSTLSKIFSKATGCGPKEWARKYRLNLARELIFEGSKDITEISYDIGYKHPSTFSTVYKKHFGVSPRQDRKNRKTQVKPHH